MKLQQLSFRVFFDIGDINTILTIKNAKLSDAGKYEVFVENNLGTDQSFARVDILWCNVSTAMLMWWSFVLIKCNPTDNVL